MPCERSAAPMSNTLTFDTSGCLLPAESASIPRVRTERKVINAASVRAARRRINNIDFFRISIYCIKRPPFAFCHIINYQNLSDMSIVKIKKRSNGLDRNCVFVLAVRQPYSSME